MAVVEIHNRGDLYWGCDQCTFRIGASKFGSDRDSMLDDFVLGGAADHELLTPGHKMQVNAMPFLSVELAGAVGEGVEHVGDEAPG